MVAMENRLWAEPGIEARVSATRTAPLQGCVRRAGLQQLNFSSRGMRVRLLGEKNI